MTDNNGEKLMKFGPEWLHNNLSRGSASVVAGLSSSNPVKPIRTVVKPKAPQYRYKRDELLALYDGKRGPPEELKQFKLIYVNKPQLPIALQYCPKRVRAKRYMQTRPDFNSSDSRFGRPAFKDFNRSAANLQPKWYIDSWKNLGARGSDTTYEKWRSSRTAEFNRNKGWNDNRGRDRREAYEHGPYALDPFAEDRHSPEDNLPEWANTEDIVNETGTFDSTGAFLPIVNKSEKKEKSESFEKKRLSKKVVEKTVVPVETPVVVPEVVVETKVEPKPIPVETPKPKTRSKMNQPPDNNNAEGTNEYNNSIIMVEKYLNTLVDSETDAKTEQKNPPMLHLPPPTIQPDIMLKPLEMPLYPPRSVMPDFNIPPPTISTPFSDPKCNFWYYQDGQMNRGPFTSSEMGEFFISNLIDSFTKVRKGYGPHFVIVGRLIEMFGVTNPFFVPEAVSTKWFNVNIPTDIDANTMANNNASALAAANPPPQLVDYLKPDNSFNAMMGEDNMPLHMASCPPPMHSSNMGNVGSQLFQQYPRMENHVQFPFSHFPNHEFLKHPPPSVPLDMNQLDNNNRQFANNAFSLPSYQEQNMLNIPQDLDLSPARGSWSGLNPPNYWNEPLGPPKLPPYVPIPMPTSEASSLPSMEVPPLPRLNIGGGNNFGSHTSNPPDIVSGMHLPNTSGISANLTHPPPTWHDLVAGVPDPRVPYDFNSSAINQRNLRNLLLAKQQHQQQLDQMRANALREFHQRISLQQRQQHMQKKPTPYSLDEPLISFNDLHIGDLDLVGNVESDPIQDLEYNRETDALNKIKADERNVKLEMENIEMNNYQMAPNYGLFNNMEAYVNPNQNKAISPPVVISRPAPWANMKQPEHPITKYPLMDFAPRPMDNPPPSVVMAKQYNTPPPPIPSMPPAPMNNPVVPKEKFTWGNTGNAQREVVPFAEIQAQEQHSKIHPRAERAERVDRAERAAPTAIMSRAVMRPTASNTQNFWVNPRTPSSATNTAEGFWDTKLYYNKKPLIGDVVIELGLTPSVPTPPPKQEKEVKIKILPRKKAAAPVAKPVTKAVAEPKAEATAEATAEPTAEPTAEATIEPTEPTGEAAAGPIEKPTVEASPAPTNEQAAKPNEKDKEDNPFIEFSEWAIKELSPVIIPGNVDVNEYVAFLWTIESPFELEEYIKLYLDDNKFSDDFTRNFLLRRSKAIAKTRKIPCDDLCSPAPAYNPGMDKREEANKGKNKKKKGRMYKVDAHILGFNATASENRFNVGNIDVP